MSLRVMHWAWATTLPPTAKLVLMALADEADDMGFCFPSHRRLATKCSITDRTVRRILGELADRGFLVVETRHRPDRSQTSNGYRLACGYPQEKMSGGEGPHVQGPRTRVTRVGVTGVLRTTTYPLSNSLPPPVPEQSNDAPAAPVLSGDGGELEYPDGVSSGERSALQRTLAGLDPTHAQEVLDELAGRMKHQRISNPVGYCAALIARVRNGQFQPELGIRIAERRAQERLRVAREIAPAGTDFDARAAHANLLPDAIRASLERMRPRQSSAVNCAAADGKIGAEGVGKSATGNPENA